MSGGEQQRVAIGRAMVRNPRVFLLDEPLSNLDADLRDRMRLEFKQLHRELNATMIYVTHDQQEAMTLADHLVVMRDGRVEQQGPPLAIYRRPANLFVASFLGKPRINLLQGEVAQSDRDSVTVGLSAGRILQVPCTAAEEMAIGEQVTVGIRPEHIMLTSSNGQNVLQGSVSVMEQLGDHGLVYVDGVQADESLVLRVDSSAGHCPGDSIMLALPAEHCRLFDSQGRSIPG